LMKILFEGRHVVLLQVAQRRGHRQLERLTNVAHLHPALHLDLLRAEIVTSEVDSTALLQGIEGGAQLGQVERGRAAHERAHGMMFQFRGQKPEGGEKAWSTGYDDAGNLQLARNPRRVDRATATKSKQRELARIATAL